MRRMMAICLTAIGLTACHAENDLPQTGNESSASLCEMLKQKIQAEDYKNSDPDTMKRKNAVDQAKLVKEYDSYSCPEIVDSAPSPTQAP